jgi:hypothetical protein
MRLYFYGRPRRRDLFPAFSAIDIVDDNYPHVIQERWYQASCLGCTINLTLRTSKRRRAYFIDTSWFVEWLSRMLA